MSWKFGRKRLNFCFRCTAPPHAHLLIDEARDALDAATAGEPADGGLGDALDVVAKDLAVALEGKFEWWCGEVVRGTNVGTPNRSQWHGQTVRLPPLVKPLQFLLIFVSTLGY